MFRRLRRRVSTRVQLYFIPVPTTPLCSGFERPLLCFRKAVYKPVGFSASKKERVFVKAKRFIRKEEAVGGKDEEMPEEVGVPEQQATQEEETMTYIC